MTIPFYNVPLADPAWAEVEKTCRRISFLRAVGRPEDAERIRATELPAVSAAVRQGANNEQDVEELIHAVETAEQKRADEAVAFAELLAPMLAKHLQPAEQELKAMRQARSLFAPAAPRLTAGGIADFIDQMLDQERHA